MLGDEVCSIGSPSSSSSCCVQRGSTRQSGLHNFYNKPRAIWFIAYVPPFVRTSWFRVRTGWVVVGEYKSMVVKMWVR